LHASAFEDPVFFADTGPVATTNDGIYVASSDQGCLSRGVMFEFYNLGKILDESLIDGAKLPDSTDDTMKDCRAARKKWNNTPAGVATQKSDAETRSHGGFHIVKHLQ